MKSTSVSTLAVSQALRYSLTRAQSELVKANKEATTFRVADVGLALGARTGRSVSFARDLERLKGIVDSNELVSGRLSSTQNALTQITNSAQSFLSTLLTASSDNGSPAVTLTSAKATLESLTATLNSTYNGEYLFAGINTDVQPVNDYDAAGSPNKAAFDAGFLGYFGFTQDDPQAANITAAQMDDFLTTVVEPQFLGAGWQTNWSSATDEGITSRIALNETLQTSVSANESGMRKLAMMAATVTSIFGSNVGEEAQAALLDRAVSVVGEAAADLAILAGKTGIIENRVQKASDRISMQADLFETSIQDMEGVDPYEASTRVTALMQQIETSYALTARIQELSLLKFLA